MKTIAIIGAGQAGAALAGRLRALGHDGRLLLIGAEDAPPYQRPPLSKKYLLGEIARERLWLKPPNHWAESGIELVTGRRAARLDAASRTIGLDDGSAIACDAIALCTGAEPIQLPAAMGGGLDGVYVMRSLGDADALAPEFRAGRRLLVVGGGYVGLEAAAVAASRGLHVTVVERESRILSRVASAETAGWFRDLHRRHGVQIRERTGLAGLCAADGRQDRGQVSRARLSDGSAIQVDFVILGIGVQPATALAETAGLALENGIRTDEFGATSAPGIHAAGDCASFPWQGGRIRLESVPNAIDHAEAVAAAMMGQRRPYVARPWFWSDQYDVKLQIAGLNTGYDRVAVRHGDRDGSRSHWYFRGPRLLAVDAMNDPRAYMTAKRMIEAGLSPDPVPLVDPATSLATVMETAVQPST